MEKQSLTFHRTASLFIIIVLGYLILKEGKFFFGPLAFATLFTVLLQPFYEFIRRLIKYKIPAILLTLLSVIIAFGIIVTLFSVQLTDIINNLPNITGRLSDGIQKITSWLNTNLNLSEFDLEKNLSGLINNFPNYISKGISFSTTFIFNILFTFLLIFFMLLYKDNFKHFILHQAKKENREQLKDILNKIKSTLQRYLYGLLLVVLILAVLNSIGLLIIGIRYAIFWGILAAFLAVIPYIGTFLGGTLPFLYALATTDNWWQPVSVVGMYIVIQSIEGNIITPNVAGSSVSVNALIALLSILIGGFIWGIAGIIIAIPAIAVVKIILEHNNRTKTLAFLFSNKAHHEDKSYWERMDDDKYRIK